MSDTLFRKSVEVLNRVSFFQFVKSLRWYLGSHIDDGFGSTCHSPHATVARTTHVGHKSRWFCTLAYVAAYKPT